MAKHNTKLDPSKQKNRKDKKDKYKDYFSEEPSNGD